MRIFWIILALYFIVQGYVLWRYYHLIPQNKLLKSAGILAIVFLLVSLPVSLFLARSLPLWLVKPFYLVGSSWMIILLYVFVPVLLLDIFRIINHFAKWVSPDKITQLTTNNGWLLLIMMGIYAGIIFIGNQNYHQKVRHEYHYDLSTKTVKVSGEGTSELTQQSLPLSCAMNDHDPLKIVMISDLHLGHTIGRKELIAWRELINAENADYIFVSGDVIDNDVRPLYAENMEVELSQFQAKKGVYMILGNHEYIAGIEESLEFLRQTNWQLLRDEVILLPENIYLIGRDDKMNPHRAELSELLKGLDPNIPMIVLDHQPINFPELAKLGDFSNSQLLISAGIGVWGGKFRIGTRSDYRVMTICQ